MAHQRRSDAGRSKERRWYDGPPELQPKDCGRPHPQPLCMCVLCEVAARFGRIEDLEEQLARIRALKEAE